MRDYEDDTGFLRRIEGLHVGSLDSDEIARFEALAAAGKARRVYQGAAGLMGLAKAARVPVAWGDGKKSRYGVTYADEVREPEWSK